MWGPQRESNGPFYVCNSGNVQIEPNGNTMWLHCTLSELWRLLKLKCLTTTVLEYTNTSLGGSGSGGRVAAWEMERS